MKDLFIFAFFMLVVIACNKGKFETKPTLKVEGYSTNFLRKTDSVLVVTVKFTDKEGDLSGGTLWHHVRRLNARPITPPLTDHAPATSIIPEFPKNNEGFIDLNLKNQDINRATFENDSIIVRIAVKDKAGNASDTITTDMIVVERR